MNNPNLTFNDLIRLNDKITEWGMDIGLRVRMQHDTDDQYDDALDKAVHAAARTLTGNDNRIEWLESIVDAIHGELDGKEWDSDTLQAIAETLLSRGYEIREPQQD